MKTIRKDLGACTQFIISDLDSAYHHAAHELYYRPVTEGFAKDFPADTSHLDRIYQNFGRYAQEMILQTARVHPTPWEKALLALLQMLRHGDVDWWLTGSAALAVRGADIAPRDLDLVVDAASAQRLGRVLLDYLVEPVLPADGWICKWFGRAFLYARIEWVGEVDSRVDKPHVSDFGPSAATRLEVIDWHGKEIRVPPLDLELQVSERRGLAERVEKIKSVMHLTDR